VNDLIGSVFPHLNLLLLLILPQTQLKSNKITSLSILIGDSLNILFNLIAPIKKKTKKTNML